MTREILIGIAAAVFVILVVIDTIIKIKEEKENDELQ